jgi:hypothetical protein
LFYPHPRQITAVPICPYSSIASYRNPLSIVSLQHKIPASLVVYIRSFLSSYSFLASFDFFSPSVTKNGWLSLYFFSFILLSSCLPPFLHPSPSRSSPFTPIPSHSKISTAFIHSTHTPTHCIIIYPPAKPPQLSHHFPPISHPRRFQSKIRAKYMYHHRHRHPIPIPKRLRYTVP